MCESHGKCQSDSSFLYDSNGTAVNTKGTIAFMDFMERTEQIVNLMGISNTKLVLGNQEDVNLRMAVLTGIRNYVLPFINFASGQLHSSGLLERWKLLGNFRALYYDVGILFGTYNSEYFRRRRVNAKGPVVFNESKPVSVKVIENLVMVFGTLLFLGAVAFAGELRETIILFFTRIFLVIGKKVRKLWAGIRSITILNLNTTAHKRKRIT